MFDFEKTFIDAKKTLESFVRMKKSSAKFSYVLEDDFRNGRGGNVAEADRWKLRAEQQLNEAEVYAASLLILEGDMELSRRVNEFMHKFK